MQRRPKAAGGPLTAFGAEVAAAAREDSAQGAVEKTTGTGMLTLPLPAGTGTLKGLLRT